MGNSSLGQNLHQKVMTRVPLRKKGKSPNRGRVALLQNNKNGRRRGEIKGQKNLNEEVHATILGYLLKKSSEKGGALL